MSGPRLSDRLRDACGDEWEALHVHPFVRGIGDGSLPLDVFRFYLEQNLHYLPEYARAMAIGATRAPDVETMRVFASELANVLASELPQNEQLRRRAIELGAQDRGGASEMAPATLACTSFLVGTAARGGPAEVMAAIVPCTWSYGEIAARLAAAGPPEHPVYREWIGFFSGAVYAQVVETMRRDFERIAEADEADEARLVSLFATAVRLEREFWDMAYRLERWPDLESPA